MSAMFALARIDRMKVLFAFLSIGWIACALVAAEKPRSSTRSLNVIPGVTEIVEAKLNRAGINNVNDLLAEGATRQGREEVAARSGLAVDQILTFVRYADLFRIKGIAESAALLGAAGVNTAAELAQRNAAGLLAKLAEVNSGRKAAAKLPNEQQLAVWIEEAKTLPTVVSD